MPVPKKSSKIKSSNDDETIVIGKYSKLHNKLNIDISSYNKEIKSFDTFTTKEEFIDYITYFQINTMYLIKIILTECKYLEYLHEFVKNDILKILKTINTTYINDKNLYYISQYIDIVELNITNNPYITTTQNFGHQIKKLKALNRIISENIILHATNLEELHINSNSRINSFAPFASTLKILNIRNITSWGRITDTHLSVLKNLEELYVPNNRRIRTILPFANTLKKLNMSGECSISQDELNHATKLEYLDIFDNESINSILPFAKTLKVLKTNHLLTNESLENATNLEELYVGTISDRITTTKPFGRTLKKLVLFGRSIDDEGISHAVNLEELHSICSGITTVKPFGQTLKCLKLTGNDIDDNGLQYAVNLEKLFIQANSTITTTKPFGKSLKELELHEGPITNDGLQYATNLEILHLNGDTGITFEPFKNSLKTLYLNFAKDITDEDLKILTKLEKLSIKYTDKITTIEPFKDTLTHLYANHSNLKSIKNAYNLEKIDYNFEPHWGFIPNITNSDDILHTIKMIEFF